MGDSGCLDCAPLSGQCSSVWVYTYDLLRHLYTLGCDPVLKFTVASMILLNKIRFVLMNWASIDYALLCVAETIWSIFLYGHFVMFGSIRDIWVSSSCSCQSFMFVSFYEADILSLHCILCWHIFLLLFISQVLNNEMW